MNIYKYLKALIVAIEDCNDFSLKSPLILFEIRSNVFNMDIICNSLVLMILLDRIKRFAENTNCQSHDLIWNLFGVYAIGNIGSAVAQRQPNCWDPTWFKYRIFPSLNMLHFFCINRVLWTKTESLPATNEQQMWCALSWAHFTIWLDLRELVPRDRSTTAARAKHMVGLLLFVLRFLCMADLCSCG